MLPNFLIIGAMKSGTTSLYEYLREHPEIYCSVTKEPWFFAWEGQQPSHNGPGDDRSDRATITRLEDYRALFAGVTTETAIGEASTHYLFYPWVPQRIRYHIPHAKLIVLLRNPVDRAYSAFMHLVRDDRETVGDFCEALALEEQRARDNWEPIWHYRRAGLYHAQLERYYRIFPRSQIRVYLFDELTTNPTALLQDVYRFLEVDDSVVTPVLVRHNVTGVARSRTLMRLLQGSNPVKSAYRRLMPPNLRTIITAKAFSWITRKIPLADDTRRELLASFRDDILKLQDLIERDLGLWLE